jgi:hypothetical protein
MGFGTVCPFIQFSGKNKLYTRTQISRRQTPGLTQGSSAFYITNAGGEPRAKPGVWRPEMWVQKLILCVQ